MKTEYSLDPGAERLGTRDAWTRTRSQILTGTAVLTVVVIGPVVVVVVDLRDFWCCCHCQRVKMYFFVPADQADA